MYMNVMKQRINAHIDSAKVLVDVATETIAKIIEAKEKEYER